MSRPLFRLVFAAAMLPLALAFNPAQAPGQYTRYADADVDFMQGMIAHHAQALAMTSLVPSRTRNESIELLAQRIQISQKDEIRLMQSWLKTRGQAVPAPAELHGHLGSGGQEILMPGMLTPKQMAQLAALSHSDFDRLFLEYMIQHHEGALAMLTTLFGSPGAAQEPETFRYASEVDRDQRTEIGRMCELLAAMAPPHHSC